MGTTAPRQRPLGGIQLVLGALAGNSALLAAMAIWAQTCPVVKGPPEDSPQAPDGGDKPGGWGS